MMDPNGSYASPNLEDQLRHMMMNRNVAQQQQQQQDSHMQHQHHNSSQGYPSRPPPGFGMPPPMTGQAQYSANVPMDRHQDFSQFLQQHQVTASAPLPPRRAPPQAHHNNFRHQGPHRNQNHRPIDPDAFNRPPPQGPHSHQNYPQHQHQQQNQHQHQNQYQQRHLYQPQSRSQPFHNPYAERQASFLDSLAMQEISKTQMTDSEVGMKDAFRIKLQHIFETLKSPDPENPLPSVELASFGSLSSGFATAGSDMDLAIVTSSEQDLSQRFSPHEHGLPRVLEKELLDNGIGARLLTRTRVPIIKICEQPPPELLDALRESRDKWDNLPDDEKYATSKPSADDTTPKKDASDAQISPPQSESQIGGAESTAQNGVSLQAAKHVDDVSSLAESTQALQIDHKVSPSADQITSKSENTQQPHQPVHDKQANRQRNDKTWKREKANGPLDFPKDGVGIQCDINFFNPLGIHNTQMLRCYSKCDSRVRPMVLFIKSWAKRRKINSSYSGTLSSYGYVLMVLHYLVNVAQPPVLPNLQHEAEANGMPSTTIDGYEVRFFDNEDLIESRARQGGVTQNNESLGKLLVGFFKYYAVNAGGFFWTRDVLSLRSQGGILSKDEKGWTGAKTEVGENKEVRHRYLFAIEDPFETTHNVARTVTHNGICAIRDEFRRTWRIISAVGRNRDEPEGGLFDELTEAEEQPPTSTAPPPTVNKAHAYGQQFPTLAGGPPTVAVQKVRSPERVPAQPVQAAQHPMQASAQEPAHSQAQAVPPAPRGKGRRQKFVPLSL
ncbi:PAP/OAS1 substrate-binding domain-containing protein [Aureobasidium pullulans]|uniref:polynucleotide adenylyltransferase n=1 Tax=Aureobasidium pullulans TaxID=5580 RepID=A0A4S9A5A3_AURPU|nr:PAP/OAS1 substrate-binding domain-containing protein [Aureobasidium pullulans]